MSTLKTKFAAGMSGVTTKIVQVLDFGALTDEQFKRVLNACKRGRVPYTGYVSYLANAAAKEAGLRPPVKISPNRWGGTVGAWNLPPEATEERFAELMQLSHVRYEMQQALAHPSGGGGYRPAHHSEPRLYPNHYGRGGYLTLPGWHKQLTACANEVMKVVNAIPGYAEDMAKLAAFVATRPRFVFEGEIA